MAARSLGGGRMSAITSATSSPLAAAVRDGGGAAEARSECMPPPAAAAASASPGVYTGSPVVTPKTPSGPSGCWGESRNEEDEDGGDVNDDDGPGDKHRGNGRGEEEHSVPLNDANDEDGESATSVSASSVSSYGCNGSLSFLQFAPSSNASLAGGSRAGTLGIASRGGGGKRHRTTAGRRHSRKPSFGGSVNGNASQCLSKNLDEFATARQQEDDENLFVLPTEGGFVVDTAAASPRSELGSSPLSSYDDEEEEQGSGPKFGFSCPQERRGGSDADDEQEVQLPHAMDFIEEAERVNATLNFASDGVTALAFGLGGYSCMGPVQKLLVPPARRGFERFDDVDEDFSDLLGIDINDEGDTKAEEEAAGTGARQSLGPDVEEEEEEEPEIDGPLPSTCPSSEFGDSVDQAATWSREPSPMNSHRRQSSTRNVAGSRRQKGHINSSSWSGAPSSLGRTLRKTLPNPSSAKSTASNLAQKLKQSTSSRIWRKKRSHASQSCHLLCNN